MQQINYVIDPDVSVEEREEIEDFYDTMNEMLERGEIVAKLNEDGEYGFHLA